jgi:hypothetical protein
MRKMKTTEINAVLSEDFDQLLEVLEIRDQFESGAFHCENCRGPISPDTVMMIFPLPERQVGFLCTKAGCRFEYAVAS